MPCNSILHKKRRADCSSVERSTPLTLNKLDGWNNYGLGNKFPFHPTLYERGI